MRTIRRTGAFKRDYKREKKGRHRKTLDDDLLAAVRRLAADKPLPQRYRDHRLAGHPPPPNRISGSARAGWMDHRDCHIKPDLVLIYRKPDDEKLDLVRLGSHSELGL